ncbi:acyl-CoA dehydrogenase family protein [Streptomyces sp. NPDC020898]|uniref:acyl-CoA dehydrogenase family protein n=1 Tax=Streptomyces sp. NPDC020898 TaxID=3365101 RepID=UPI0037A3FD0D
MSDVEMEEKELSSLRRQAREWAKEMRSHSLVWDAAGSGVTTHHRPPELELHTALATLSVPERYGGTPVLVRGRRLRTMSALERVVLYEEGAWGDAALLMAAPGALTAGPVVESLGDRTQQDWFYERLLGGAAWSLLAMTEAAHGSDAGGMRSSLSPLARSRTTDATGYSLNGAKTYVGNATRAGTGVVFARTGEGPLSLRAVLVETDAPGFASAPVATIGLSGALGRLTFDAVEIDAERVLGQHLSPVKRGMWGWLRAFNLLRVAAAAMGVGIARAAHEYAREHRSTPSARERDRLDRMAHRIDTVRQLTYQAARAVDADPGHGHLSAAAKVGASRLAERTTLEVLRFFGCGARLKHPLLDKWARDALGLEYMEGTSNIQRLQVFNTLARGGPAAAGPPPSPSPGTG